MSIGLGQTMEGQTMDPMSRHEPPVGTYPDSPQMTCLSTVRHALSYRGIFGIKFLLLVRNNR